MEKHIYTPWALKKTKGGKVIGCFEDVGFGCSFVNDAEAVELHGAADQLHFSFITLKERELWPAADNNTQPIHLQVTKI